jgi:histone H3/H4
MYAPPWLPPQERQVGMYKTMTESSISRASIRRLAHDAQQRLTKQSYEAVLLDLEEFLHNVINISLKAALFSRRKAISHEHVVYATHALQMTLPPELVNMSAEDLTKITRCNIRAPPVQRKRNPLHAEVSEASFARVVKRVAGKCRQRLRLSAQARRFLHLVAEQRMLDFFASHKSATVASGLSDRSTADTLQRVMSTQTGPCSEEDAQALVDFLMHLTNQVPALLKISQTRTVDARLVRAAAGSVVPVFSVTCATEACADPQLVRVAERILRGRAADKRVTIAAARELACLLQNQLKTRNAMMAAACSAPKTCAPASPDTAPAQTA